MGPGSTLYTTVGGVGVLRDAFNFNLSGSALSQWSRERANAGSFSVASSSICPLPSAPQRRHLLRKGPGGLCSDGCMVAGLGSQLRRVPGERDLCPSDDGSKYLSSTYASNEVLQPSSPSPYSSFPHTSPTSPSQSSPALLATPVDVIRKKGVSKHSLDHI